MKIELTPARRVVLSGLLSALVGMGVWLHLAHERKRMTAGLEMQGVLVARQYVAAGKVIAPGAVTTRPVPRAFVEPGAMLTLADLGIGGRARVSVLKGEQLTRSKVEPAGSRPGLAWVIPPGQRALGLRLPAEHIAAGHLVPGDRVDVLAVPRRDSAEAARVLVRRARVLSVGERLWDPAEAAFDSSSASGGAAESVLVSVLLSPEEAARVAASSERETLMLALASPLGDGGAFTDEETP